ncbi:MAG: DUF4870 domain-containing protein [Deltaproteobacteria bacterium]|nr:DUF4870 domain-containing protein [Deltaproteobacteria bacterium]
MENQTQDQANGSMPASAPAADMATEKRDQDAAMIFLSYFGIFALIPYLTVKDSDFIRWHSKQGLTLCGTSIALMIASTILGFIPILGMIIGLLAIFAQLGLFVLDIVAMVKAFGGERWKIPVVSSFAEKW